jgi:hypothetical protein
MITKRIGEAYLKDLENSNLAVAKLELYIYEGVKDVTPDAADLKYSIVKAEIGGSNYVVFEISDLVKDYIESKYDGEYDSYCVWVNPVITAYSDILGTIPIASPTVSPSDYSSQFIATEGYGYFEEGVNPDFDEGLMMSEGTIYRVNDRSVNIPISAETTNDDDNTNQKIQYIASDSNSTADSYKERVLEDGGIFEDNTLLEAFEESFDIGAVDEVWVNYTNATETRTKILKVKTFDCSKYEPIRVTFVNKYGALQDFYFTRKSNESVSVKKDAYKASIVDFSGLSVAYDTTGHQQRTLNLIGNESITLNTDYIDESCNEHIRQLMLSEQVWMTRLTDEELIFPLTLKSQSVQMKTSLNDKMIQYTMNFDIANDKINSVK